MKKEIRVYSVHPWANTLENFMIRYHFDRLTSDFDFVWDDKTPQYVFASEHIYSSYQAFRDFFRLWESGRAKDRIFIGYLEEAIEPDLNLFDYAAVYSTEFARMDRVIRLLPVHTKFKIFYVPESHPAASPQEARDILRQKTKFCDFLYSHAYQERDDIFTALSEYKGVDALGARFHNTDYKPTGFFGHAQETTALHRPYKFTIAVENGSLPGYTSEKLMTALQANTVPIYWGNPEIADDFNPACYINANDCTDFHDLIERVREIDTDDELWCSMISQPWQTEEQVRREEAQVEEYYRFFHDLFSSSVSDAKRLSWTMHMDAYQDWVRRNAPARPTVFHKGLGALMRLVRSIKG